MKNTSLAKTLTASLPGEAQATFARISDPDSLPSWHASFCRSLRKDNGSIFVESPRGEMLVHFIRDDHSRVLDIAVRVSEGVTLTHAIRLIPNGEGCEIIWTLVKPSGITDSVFNEHLRWAGSALHTLRKTPVQNRTSQIEDRKSNSVTDATSSAISDTRSAISDAVEPLQAPSPAEVSSMPLSGKKLFIGNLSYDWTDDQLRAHFAEQGTIALAEVARFRGRGGRSRGFGFIEMSTETEAQSAIEKLHGSMAGGRQIIVRLAKSQEARPAKPMESKSETAAPAEAPDPGNERIPRTPRAPMHRQRNERPPRRTSAAPSRQRPSSEPRPYQEQDISNKSGYEIFPRRGPRSSEPSQTSLPSSAPPSRPSREASPYMDDTGDIENHGRSPRHRRRS